MKIGIGTKLIGSFLILAVLVMAIGIISRVMLGRVQNSTEQILKYKAPLKDVSMEAVIAAERAISACRDFRAAKQNLDSIEAEINEAVEDFDMWIAMMMYGTDSEQFRSSAAGQMYVKDGLDICVQRADGETLSLANKISTEQSSFAKAAGQLIAAHKNKLQYHFTFDGAYYDLANFLYVADVQHRDWFKALSDAIEYEVDFQGQTDPTACWYGKWVYSFETTDEQLAQLLEDSKEIHKQFHQVGADVLAASATDKESLLSRGNRYITKTIKQLEKIRKYASSKIAETTQQEKLAIDQIDKIAENMVSQLGRLEEIVDGDITSAKSSMDATSHRAKSILLVLMVFAGVLTCALVVMIIQQVVGLLRKIKRTSESLTETSEQVGSASAQVSSSSQSLAEGATEQAAGLEEVSSSLEEMSSMTKQNADNAQQANTLSGMARKAADTGTESMDRMNSAIQEIQKSSDETAKIIKVIDEIAFQTNLLALNAAVEAARAGEAGKGFAVVAEEVRNLAMRSAEAAKNTASMIEESVKNSKNGVDIAGEVAKVLDEIVSNVGKTTDLISEIAAASQEQAQGIEQVNNAVAQMDKVTQQNAANAEESASASEELSAQAEQMNGVVSELAALVGGSTARKSSGSHLTVAHSAAKRTEELVAKHHKLSQSDDVFHKIAGGTERKFQKRSDSKRAQKAQTAAVDKTEAEKVIPLKDNVSDDVDELNI